MERRASRPPRNGIRVQVVWACSQLEAKLINMEANSQFAVFAVETHAGRLWSLLMLLALVAPVVGVAVAPRVPRWPLLFAAVVCLGVFAMAWSGFQYRFAGDGVEVRTLGFRLRSIPRSAILGYSIEPWSLMRGYGIRGIGSGARAYVWCNKVVHIRTSDGEIYLGHEDPERIVRDLDQMMGVVTKG
jgi:hypothetical protein